MGLPLEVLDSKHPSYDDERWCEVAALSKGGKHYRSLLNKFLPQNPSEPDDVYSQRSRESHLVSYSAAIINLYVSWLFAARFGIKATNEDTGEQATLDKFYGKFQENVGNETELSDFMKERFRACLENQVSYWVIEKPSDGGVAAQDADEFEKRGLGNCTLKPLDRCEVYDWEENEDGSLKWVTIHTLYKVRKSWAAARDTYVETWRIYEGEQVHTYQCEYVENKRPSSKDEIPKIDSQSGPHGFKRVPVVRMCIPLELCIGEQTYDPQLEHFRIDCALSWLIRRTCYAQPVINLSDEETSFRLGVGYAIVLGKDDKFGWTSPPVAPFDVLQKNLEAKRDEIYRIVHQMAQAVDNNAETVGRSAESKEIDAAATRIMLNTYGEFVSKAIEEMYEIVSEARGEKLSWSVEGFSGYDTATVSSLIANAQQARAIGIPSATFHREVCTKAALAMLPEVDDRVKETIKQEIKDAKFKVSSDMPDTEVNAASAALDRAKADAEPLKAKAAVKSASRPVSKAVP